MVVKSCRIIRPGDEITISYGVHFKLSSKTARRQFLQQRLVYCTCAQCNNDVLDHNVCDLRITHLVFICIYISFHSQLKINSIDCNNCGESIPVTVTYKCNGCHRKTASNVATTVLLAETEMRMQLLETGTVNWFWIDISMDRAFYRSVKYDVSYFQWFEKVLDDIMNIYIARMPHIEICKYI